MPQAAPLSMRTGKQRRRLLENHTVFGPFVWRGSSLSHRKKLANGNEGSATKQGQTGLKK
jgi:hypothetical protein